MSNFNELYSPDKFAHIAQEVIHVLKNYLTAIQDRSLPVLKVEDWQQAFPRWKIEEETDIAKLIHQILQSSQHVHHPGYIGHQVSVPLPLTAITEMVATLLNNSTAIIEMSSCHAMIEKHTINWLNTKVGFPEGASGFLTSGGSLGNLTALLAARQVKGKGDIWNEGLQGQKLAIMVSEHSHYCAKRAAQIMGMGKESVITIPANTDFLIEKQSVVEAYEQAREKGYQVIAVVGSACNTGPGTFEDLNMLADFCEQHNLWFHVDGAHGATTVLSPNYRHLVAGIQRADSIVWDIHKMMLTPSLTTAVLFAREEDSKCAIQQEAPYLYEEEEMPDWLALSKKTMECTKRSMALSFYLALRVYGEEIFTQYVERCYDLTKSFAELLEASPRWELARYPQGNIICFRYLPSDGTDLDSVQKHIREKILQTGNFYLVQTTLNNKIYLRSTIMNPLTTITDLQNFLDQVEEIMSM